MKIASCPGRIRLLQLWAVFRASIEEKEKKKTKGKLLQQVFEHLVIVKGSTIKYRTWWEKSGH